VEAGAIFVVNVLEQVAGKPRTQGKSLSEGRTAGKYRIKVIGNLKLRTFGTSMY